MPIVREIVELWKRNTCNQQSARTLEGRLHYLKLFVEKFGEVECSALQLVDVELWITFNPQWASDWTLKNVKATLNVPFNWAADPRRRYIAANPLAGMTHCDGRRGRPLTADEFAAWMRRSTPLFRRVLLFVRLAGVRPGEMSVLEWRGEDTWIDAERGCGVWMVHKTSRKQKVKKPRVVPLHPVLVKLLIWIRRNGGDGRHVFTNSRGRPWDRRSLALRIMRLREATGTPKTAKLYGCRHAFATDCVKHKVSLATLAELLGHSSTRMSEYYVHLAGDVEHLHQAVQQTFGGEPSQKLQDLATALRTQKPDILPFAAQAAENRRPLHKRQCM